MNRDRRVACVAAALSAVLLLSAAPAAAAPPEATIVIAVEEPAGEGELPGPEPSPNSPFAPAEYQTPWTWWMGVLLAVAGVLTAIYVGLGYYFLVKRPRDRARQM